MASDVENFLKSFSSGVSEVAMKIRKLILNLDPNLVEKVYPGWKAVGYSPSGGMKDAVFAITPYPSHVNLVFFKGIELSDPKGLLEGTGKKGRHVKIKNIDDLDNKALLVLMESATKRH